MTRTDHPEQAGVRQRICAVSAFRGDHDPAQLVAQLADQNTGCRDPLRRGQLGRKDRSAGQKSKPTKKRPAPDQHQCLSCKAIAEVQAVMPNLCAKGRTRRAVTGMLLHRNNRSGGEMGPIGLGPAHGSVNPVFSEAAVNSAHERSRKTRPRRHRSDRAPDHRGRVLVGMRDQFARGDRGRADLRPSLGVVTA